MMVECLIKREGPTPVELGRTRYMFMPIPDPNRKSGEPSTSVCEINAEEHLEFLLKSNQFRPYKMGQSAPKDDNIDLSGYSIVIHREGKFEGYRIENNGVKPKLYVGTDGVWKKVIQGLTPFDSEFAAWQWLRDEVRGNEQPESPEEEGE